jgi:hypothetical protein
LGILTKAVIPRIIDNIAVSRIAQRMRKIFDSGTNGNEPINAILNNARIKDHMAIALVLAVFSWGEEQPFFKLWPHEWHACALSVFSVPHFGQNI